MRRYMAAAFMGAAAIAGVCSASGQTSNQFPEDLNVLFWSQGQRDAAFRTMETVPKVAVNRIAAGGPVYPLPEGEPLDVQYGPAHGVTLTAGGVLAGLNGDETELEVNSIHQQAIDRLADGLVTEAVAPDGTIEAVRIAASQGFAIGVQWHPEHRFEENPFSRRLFSAFGRAVRAHAARRGA